MVCSNNRYMENVNLNWDVKDHHCLFVIGNGFDIDLGFPTRYKDYVGNENPIPHNHFPFIKGGHDFHELGDYILHATTIQKWYDLENVLAVYGSKEEALNNRNFVYGTEDNDREDFEKLVTGLYNYLSSLDLSAPIETSVAARILKSIPTGLLFPTFYSFNYTDLELIGKALGVDVSSPYYIHGNLKNNDLVLGVGDYAPLRDTVDFLYKSSQDSYHSSSLLLDLNQCDTLVIFGLSLSRVDYPYFKDFFYKVSSGKLDKRPYIRIITFDNSSKREILRNLRRMNDGMIGLWNYSDFDIIRTKDNMDENKVIALINHIKKRCSYL